MGQWFVFNDHKVELAQKSDVLNSKAYLLFYVVRSLSLGWAGWRKVWRGVLAGFSRRRWL